jgi:hypothetical protein
MGLHLRFIFDEHNIWCELLYPEIQNFWDVTPCRYWFKYFMTGQSEVFFDYLAANMTAVDALETSVTIYHSIRGNYSVQLKFEQYRCETPKSHTILTKQRATTSPPYSQANVTNAFFSHYVSTKTDVWVQTSSSWCRVVKTVCEMVFPV